MAIFPESFDLSGQQTISLERGIVESVIGGVTSQWDIAGTDLEFFEVQFGPIDSLTRFAIGFFLVGSGIQEETEFTADGITYVGVFTGKIVTEYVGKYFILKADFVGREQ